jgi:hypothetical protein
MIHGVRLGVDFVLRHRPKPYVNRKRFFEYVDTVFVPYLNELQGLAEFCECEAVVLIENCSLHMADEVVALLTSLRVRIITFAPHTTHIFQNLDVVLFCMMKKHDTGLKDLDETLPAAAFLIRVYHDLKQTMIEVNIWGAFAAIGFSYDIMETPYRLLFDEQKLRQSRGFIGLWDRDTRLESLLTCRQQAQLGWINKPG